MAITWSQAHTQWILAKYSWAEFSLAYELDLIRGSSSRRRMEYEKLWKKSPEKKERFIELFLKVNGMDMKHKAKLSPDIDVDISDIDMVIQEVLFKPKVSISVA
jgi:hypothetical protein